MQSGGYDCGLFAVRCFCHSTHPWRIAWVLPVLPRQNEAASAKVSAGRTADTISSKEDMHVE